MLDKIQDFNNYVFEQLKTYITASYPNAYVFKQEPKDSLFPLVVVKNTGRNNSYTTLKYTDETYVFTLQINVYAVSTEGTAGASTCEELSNIIEKFFTEEMKMQLNITPNADNLDDNVNRTIIYATCSIDTKFKDKIVYYPY